MPVCLCSREPFIILSGGLSYDTVGRRPCLTVMHGKSTAVLEMDYPIVDFLTLCETPYPNGKFFSPYVLMWCVHFWASHFNVSSFYPPSINTLDSQTNKHTPFLFFNYVGLLAPVIVCVCNKYEISQGEGSYSTSIIQHTQYYIFISSLSTPSIRIQLLSYFLYWGVNSWNNSGSTEWFGMLYVYNPNCRLCLSVIWLTYSCRKD